MKCPKCSYLGFETGDRCKNCGYDFSLIAPDVARESDACLALRLPEEPMVPATDWLERIDSALGQSAPSRDPQRDLPPIEPSVRARAAAAQPTVESDARLPLFGRAIDSDEPLIKLPAAPRVPLSVRRTPEARRLRAVSKPGARFERQPEPEPVLEFADAPAPSAEPPRPAPVQIIASNAVSRLAAAGLDHLILLAIDAAVVYLTLRMAGLAPDGWAALPPVPLLAFLLLVKLSYFCAFTAVGGQTIGKMAARIRVVTEEGAPVDGTRAVSRALAGAVSAALLGLGFVPALLGSDRRALHDRVTRTRVVIA